MSNIKLAAPLARSSGVKTLLALLALGGPAAYAANPDLQETVNYGLQNSGEALNNNVINPARNNIKGMIGNIRSNPTVAAALNLAQNNALTDYIRANRIQNESTNELADIHRRLAERQQQYPAKQQDYATAMELARRGYPMTQINPDDKATVQKYLDMIDNKIQAPAKNVTSNPALKKYNNFTSTETVPTLNGLAELLSKVNQYGQSMVAKDKQREAAKALHDKLQAEAKRQAQQKIYEAKGVEYANSLAKAIAMYGPEVATKYHRAKRSVNNWVTDWLRMNEEEAQRIPKNNYFNNNFLTPDKIRNINDTNRQIAQEGLLKEPSRWENFKMDVAQFPDKARKFVGNTFNGIGDYLGITGGREATQTHMRSKATVKPQHKQPQHKQPQHKQHQALPRLIPMEEFRRRYVQL